MSGRIVLANSMPRRFANVQRGLPAEEEDVEDLLARLGRALSGKGFRPQLSFVVVPNAGPGEKGLIRIVASLGPLAIPLDMTAIQGRENAGTILGMADQLDPPMAALPHPVPEPELEPGPIPELEPDTV